MPRKGHIAKREIMPDPMYNSVVVTKLINKVMWDGNGKRICEGCVRTNRNVRLFVMWLCLYVLFVYTETSNPGISYLLLFMSYNTGVNQKKDLYQKKKKKDNSPANVFITGSYSTEDREDAVL